MATTTFTSPAEEVRSIESDLFYLNMELRAAERKVQDLRDRVAEKQARIAELTPSTIEYVGLFTGDRKRIHAALRQVRSPRSFPGASVSLRQRTKYGPSDELVNTTYVDFDYDVPGLGMAIYTALQEQGLAVEWSGNPYNAVRIHPTFVRISYRTFRDYDGDYRKEPTERLRVERPRDYSADNYRWDPATDTSSYDQTVQVPA